MPEIMTLIESPTGESAMADIAYVPFATRLDVESAERRRRLEQKTGFPAYRLIAEALRVLEEQLGSKETTKA
jgi:hypothetical protein